MQVLIYDANSHLVRHLGLQYSYVAEGSFSVAPNPYAPEEGSLTATAGAFLWPWAGDKADGSAVPNGQYLFVLKQSGAADLSAHAWVEHKAAQLGDAVFYPNPARSVAYLALPGRPGVSTELKLYSLAGDLVLRLQFLPLTTLAAIELKSASGAAFASGIYIAQVRLRGQGGVEQLITRKLAVLR